MAAVVRERPKVSVPSQTGRKAAIIGRRYATSGGGATNLFNQFYKQTAYDGVLQTFSTPPALNPNENNYYYFPGQPRFYGATLKVRFE